jgi:2'-5' RNA ligase
MAKIAVDVVLLPSEQMMDKAIEVNRELLKQCPDAIILDKEHCLPHISLAMGCIDDMDLAGIENTLRSVAANHCPGPLYSEGLQTGINANNEKVSVLLLKKTKRLQSLHETVMRKLAPYFIYEVTAETVLAPPVASEGTLLWIKHYPEKSSFEKFSPHITLGYGQIESLSFPSEFTAPRLALCHLGNHCTCRKILTSTALQN